jgi:hypothetical protein
MADTGREVGELNVLISYSQDDLGFVEQLDAALEVAGFKTIIARHERLPAETWKTQLGDLIRYADTIVFVLSPSSADSDIFAWQVAEAAELGKRIFPVICRSLESAKPPQQLAELNCIFLYAEPKSPGSGFGSGLAQLITALKADLDWSREHTNYLRQASYWDNDGRHSRRLLSGPDIAAAKAWAARRPKNVPGPTALQLDFIKESEAEYYRRESLEAQRLEDIAKALAEREKALEAREEALKEREEVAEERKTATIINKVRKIMKKGGLTAETLREIDSNRENSPSEDLISFGASFPAAVTPLKPFLLKVWIFQQKNLNEARERAIEEAGGMAQFQAQGSQLISRMSKVNIRLEIEQCTVDPPVDTVIWGGETINAAFHAKLNKDIAEGTTLRGDAFMDIDGLRIGEVRFDLIVGTSRHHNIALGETVRRGFVSYATMDRWLVLGRVQGIRKMG